MMRPDEAQAAQKQARKAFGWLEVLFIPKPKQALVAVLDERIVGGFFYNVKTSSGVTLGDPTFFFVDPALQGQGIGKQLCDAGIRHMWEQEGCDAVATFVRDDNVPSWGALVRNGFVRTSLPKMARALGFGSTAKLFFTTVYGIALGYDYYIALPEKAATRRYEKKSGAGQVGVYLLLHMLLLAPALIFSEAGLSLAAAFGIVFAGNVLAGYLGTLFSQKRKWRFRQPGGGIFICFINAAFGIFFPMCGNWYPARYENTPRFRRDLALNSICSWLFLLAIYFAGFWLLGAYRVLTYAVQLSGILLILRCIPVPPFGPYGGWRVFRWNKAIFVLLAIPSIVVFIFTFL